MLNNNICMAITHNTHFFIVHYLTKDLQRRLGLLKQGVTIFTMYLNDLNAEKIPAQRCDLNPRQAGG